MSGGHGHVVPRPDGVKARCGGPALCGVCAKELAAQSATVTAPTPGQAAYEAYWQARGTDVTTETNRWALFSEARSAPWEAAAQAALAAQERPAPGVNEIALTAELAQARRGLRDLADVHDALLGEILRNAGDDMDLIDSPEQLAVKYVRSLEAGNGVAAAGMTGGEERELRERIIAGLDQPPQWLPQQPEPAPGLGTAWRIVDELRAKLAATVTELAVSETERDDLRQRLDERNAQLDDFTHAVIDLDARGAIVKAAHAVRKKAGMTVIDSFSKPAGQ